MLAYATSTKGITRMAARIGPELAWLAVDDPESFVSTLEFAFTHVVKDAHNLTWAADIISVAIVAPEVMRWHRVTGLLLGCLLPPPGAAKLKPGSLPPSIDKLTASTCLALGYEEEPEWPVQFLQVFLDDYFSVKSWVDSPHCSRFVANLCCSIGLPFVAPFDAVIRPRFHHVELECRSIILNAIQARITPAAPSVAGNILHFATTDAIVAVASCDVLFALEALSCALCSGNVKLISRLCGLSGPLPGCPRVLAIDCVDASVMAATALRLCVYGADCILSSPSYARALMTSPCLPVKQLPAPAALWKLFEDAKLPQRIDFNKFLRALVPHQIVSPAAHAAMPNMPAMDVSGAVCRDGLLFRIVSAGLDTLGRQCVVWKLSEYVSSSGTEPLPDAPVSFQKPRASMHTLDVDEDTVGLGTDFAPVKKRKVAPGPQTAAVVSASLQLTSTPVLEAGNIPAQRGIVFQLTGVDAPSVQDWCGAVCQTTLRHLLQYVGKQYDTVMGVFPQYLLQAFRSEVAACVSAVVLCDPVVGTNRPPLIDSCFVATDVVRMLLLESTRALSSPVVLHMLLQLLLRKPSSIRVAATSDAAISVLQAINGSLQGHQGHPGAGLDWGDCHFTALKLTLCWSLRHCNVLGDAVWYGRCGVVPAVCWWYIVTNQWDLPWPFMSLVVEELSKRSRGVAIMDVFPTLPLSTDQVTELKTLMSRFDAAGSVTQAPIRNCGKSYFNEAVEVTVENITALSSLNCDVSWVLSSLRSQRDVSAHSLLKLSRMQGSTHVDTSMIDTLRQTFGVDILVDAVLRCKRLPATILADAVAGYVAKLSAEWEAKIGPQRTRVLQNDAVTCLRWLFDQCVSHSGCRFLDTVITAVTLPVCQALEGLPCHGYDILCSLLSNGKPVVSESLKRRQLPPCDVITPPSWIMMLAMCPSVVSRVEAAACFLTGVVSQTGRLLASLSVPSDSSMVVDAVITTMLLSIACNDLDKAPLRTLVSHVLSHDDMYVHVMLSNETAAKCIMSGCDDPGMTAFITSSPMLHASVRGSVDGSPHTNDVRFTCPPLLDAHPVSESKRDETLSVPVSEWLHLVNSNSLETSEAALRQCYRIAIKDDADVAAMSSAAAKLDARIVERVLLSLCEFDGHGSAAPLVVAIAVIDRVDVPADVFVCALKALRLLGHVEQKVIGKLALVPRPKLFQIAQRLWSVLPTVADDTRSILCDSLVTLYVSQPREFKAICDDGAVGISWSPSSDVFGHLFRAGFRCSRFVTCDSIPSVIAAAVLNSEASDFGLCMAQSHPTLSLLCLTLLGRRLTTHIEGSYDAPTADSSVGIVPVHVIKRFVKSTHRVDVALHACRLLRRLQSFILAHRDMVMATPSLLSAVATVLQPLIKLLHYITAARTVESAGALVDELAVVVRDLSTCLPALMRPLVTECLRGIGKWKKLAKHYNTEFVAQLASKGECKPATLSSDLLGRWKAEIANIARVRFDSCVQLAAKHARCSILLPHEHNRVVSDDCDWKPLADVLDDVTSHIHKPYEAVDTRIMLGLLLPVVNFRAAILPDTILTKLMTLFIGFAAVDIRILPKVQRTARALEKMYTPSTIPTNEAYRQLMDSYM